MKQGLMPVMAVAFRLSRRDTIALYRQGVFQARFKDLDVEYLAKAAADIQLRWMDLSEISRRMLSAKIPKEQSPSRSGFTGRLCRME